MGHVVHILTEQLSGGPTEHCLGRGVNVSDQSLQIESIQARGHVVHGQPEAFLALAESDVRQLAFGYVYLHPCGLQDVPISVHDGAYIQKHGSLLSPPGLYGHLFVAKLSLPFPILSQLSQP